ncbi:MAG: hypothetical protein JSS81_21750 [Acidobacteria bacterium]|nr:hypothetical protein [Acidobacteriota bacterium]
MKYENENQIAAMVAAFENGTIADADWRHAEHLIAAYHYLSKHDFETALGKMRDGILNLLKAFGADSSKYHETLTVFWMRTVDDFRKSNPALAPAEACRLLTEKYGRDYVDAFYSPECLATDKARTEYVAPDRV